MRRTSMLALLLVVGCGGRNAATSGGGKKTPLTAKDIVQRSSPAIVRIETKDGLGTGFIIDKGGLVATNLHVVRGMKEIKVKLYGGETYPVLEVVGVDPMRDLALLRIGPPKALPTLRLGDSDAMTAGDQVVAIGNPLGIFEYSVSSGLVSQVRPVCTPEAVALHKKMLPRFHELIKKPQLTEEERNELEQLQCSQELKILQISAPISQGSSGGPLFNQSGEVVGVTTLIVTAGQNINFAIPTNYLKVIAAKPAQISMDEFATKTQALRGPGEGAPGPDPDVKITREIPKHDVSVFAGCSPQQISDLVHNIWDTIKNGAPLYNAGNHEACFRIYEGTSTKQERDGGCKGVKSAFGDGLLRATAKTTYKEKAWALRDTFDGLLEAAERYVQAGNSLPDAKKP
ncbi:MAG: trypsin-like peptidase domain-containing protein [Deltaproteobacteria bacterium]|nr:trypsin-like peptidase domain-containing protein [Deltaproteobacteria bacterium]MCW5802735.1 trypsin-like peptidase domain-containing protein [Deltaproteobacteria bacterium]